MQYKNFLFDWDGSLADTLPDWFRVHKLILRENGIEVSNEVVCEETFGKMDASELGIRDTEKYLSEIEKVILPSLENATLNLGVLEVLKLIKEKGGKIGVITDSKKRWVKHALRNNGLRNIVDVFLAREDVTYRKPDPEIVFGALKFIGGKVKDTLVTGDNWRDVEAARAAGAESCLYLPNRYKEFYDEKKQKNLGATFTIEDFRELNAVL